MKINKIQKIQKLSSTLANEFVPMEWIEPDWEANAMYIESNKKLLGEFYPYYSLLHDSWNLGITSDDNNFSLTLTDIITQSFAHTYASIINQGKAEFKKYIFPTKFIFKNVKKIKFCTVLRSGKIKPIDNYNLKYFETYLYDDFLTLDQEIKELGITFFSKKRIRRTNYILFLIAFEKIEVNEDYKNYWKKYFPEDTSNLFDEFRELRKNRKVYDDYTSNEKLIKEILKID